MVNNIKKLNSLLLIYIFLLGENFIEGKEGLVSNFAKHVKTKEEIVKENKKRALYKLQNCAFNVSPAHHVFHRHARDVTSLRNNRGGDADRSRGDRAAYFSGRELLRLRLSRKNIEVEIPRLNFTVEVWVKPAGGQSDPSTIIGIYDVCLGTSTLSGWSIGIGRTRQDSRPQPKLQAWLKTERAPFGTWLQSNHRYKPDTWYHVAMTYDGEKTKLYVNGAMLAVGFDQRGELYTVITKKCKEIHIGGNLEDGTFFRGIFDSFRIWNSTLTHNDIVRNLHESTDEIDNSELVFEEKFKNLKWWRPLSKRTPKLITTDRISTQSEISINKPKCGKTVCDDPTLIKGFLHNDQLRTKKEIRYRIVNVMNDDGSNPVVTREQIMTSHRSILRTFSPYNISWELVQHNIRNTTLRQKLILLACNPNDIGNGICDMECRYSRTGNDGGDCEPFLSQCDYSNLGNGRCDFECNKEYHLWDKGDCCSNENYTHISCFDPKSIHRGYLGIDEFKASVGLDGSTHLNIYFASHSVSNLVGIATYPWDKNVYSIQGGIVTFPDTFGIPGSEKSLVHELGHVLGLFHVHHGVSEMDCSDPCLETEPSMELGDLCSDTRPTPNNTQCHDPDWAGVSCGIRSYSGTPYRNYMSYADDSCIDHFTPQQTARMHCYISLAYQSWITSPNPAPVPLQPRVVRSTSSSVTLAWLTPFRSQHATVNDLCDLCDDHDACYQYATRSSSSHSSENDFDFGPSQAEGPPDANRCDISVFAWMPETTNLTLCQHKGCYIDLGIDYPIVPAKLSVWVVMNADEGIKDIELHHSDGSKTSLGGFSAYCDTALTVRLNVMKPVDQVRIFVSTPYVAIDALHLSTENNYRKCRACGSRKYRIRRSPPFSDGAVTKQSKRPEFTDEDVIQDQQYAYSISVQKDARESVKSPTLTYIHGQSFCGDGVLNEEEQCDDNNLGDGDGCTTQCVIEDGFHCTGSPSMCFLHDGDGVCEDFERTSNVIDCGFFTPEGFEDQWVLSAVTNPVYHGRDCPATLLTGIPESSSRCTSTLNMDGAWFPCERTSDPGNYWIEAYFAKAVVAAAVLIHLGSDGRASPTALSPLMRVELISADNATKPVSVSSRKVSCKDNPVTVEIKQDLSRPITMTIGVRIRFASRNISIIGIRLRSPRYWNPLALSSCADNEMYHPKSGLCVPKTCTSTCDSMQIDNGQMNCSGYREGDICKLSCNEGYEVSSTANEYICINGSWSSIASTSCLPVKCAKPEVSFATVSCKDFTPLGGTCRFKCNPPAKLRGQDNVLTCEKDRQWSSTASFCQVLCNRPDSVVNHAKLLSKSCKKGFHFIGKRCKFRCLKGYHVKDRRPNRKMVKISCQEDGNWRGMQCERTTCPAIEPKFISLFTCTDLRFAGSACTMTCQGQDPQRIKCTYDGKWTGSFSMCRSGVRGDCPYLQNTIEIDFECNDNYVGYQCNIACVLPGYIPVMVKRLNTIKDVIQNPVEDAPVRQITCTALSKWYPDPRRLQCIPTCNLDYAGDGWCDAVNNNERCKWDGGDCCKSTSSIDTVLPVPEDCGMECSCLDPTARENKPRRKKRPRKRKFRRRKHI